LGVIVFCLYSFFPSFGQEITPTPTCYSSSLESYQIKHIFQVFGEGFWNVYPLIFIAYLFSNNKKSFINGKQAGIGLFNPTCAGHFASYWWDKIGFKLLGIDLTL